MRSPDPVPAAGPGRSADVGLTATRMSLTYPGAEAPVLSEVSAAIPHGRLTVVVGPNACGKSTLLRALGRILRPGDGEVVLDGRAVAAYGAKEFARKVAFLPQSATAPEGITVGDLIARGRYPHQGLMRQWQQSDEDAVVTALERTGTSDLADRPVADLSGGQRQRVWIAMVLAQQTDILLLDEPTTFLDIAHQLDVLELCRELVQEHGVTVMAVLHDLAQAARYGDHVIAMRDGRVLAHGSPEHVITAETVHEVFGVAARVVADPETGTPLVVPEAGKRSRRTGVLSC